jgi:hypothetical protein
VLLLNAIESFVEGDDSYLSSYRTGETWHVPVDYEGAARVVDPQGRVAVVPVEAGRVVVVGQETGFYEMRPADGSRPPLRFASNLGPGAESDIRPERGLQLGDRPLGEVSPSATIGLREEIWLYLVAFVLAVLAVEWFTYHRRWTV